MALNLGKQYGPLPLGGWAVVIVGGLGVGYFINRSQGAAGPAADDGTGDGTGVIGDPSGAGGGQFIYDPPTSVPTPEDTTPDDNMQWGRKVKDWLAGQGFDAYLTSNAVEKYLSGQKLSVQEQAWISLAIVKFGNAPEGVTPIDDPSTPKPPPVVTPKPVDTWDIAFTNAPTTGRRGAPVSFSGTIKKNGKGVATMLLVERMRPNSSVWEPHSADASNTTGKWGVITSFGSAGNWRYRVRHPTSGKTTSRTIRIT